MLVWLSGLPVWVSLPLVVAAYCAFAACSCLIAHRVFRATGIDLSKFEAGPFASVVAIAGAAAGTLFGFGIINLWLNFRTCEINSIREATTATTLNEYFAIYPLVVRTQLRGVLGDYVDHVIREEFPMLAKGRDFQEQDRQEERLRIAILDPNLPHIEIPVRTQLLNRFATLNDLRHERLAQGGTVLTESLWIPLIGTGLLTFLSALWFNIPDLRVKLSVLMLIATAYGVLMFVIIQLNHPYTGPTAVSPQPFIDALREIRTAQGK